MGIFHNGSDGFWLTKVSAFPDVGFAIAIMANATLDKDDNAVESTAFAEVQQRQMHCLARRSLVAQLGCIVAGWTHLYLRFASGDDLTTAWTGIVPIDRKP